MVGLKPDNNKSDYGCFKGKRRKTLFFSTHKRTSYRLSKSQVKTSTTAPKRKSPLKSPKHKVPRRFSNTRVSSIKRVRETTNTPSKSPSVKRLRGTFVLSPLQKSTPVDQKVSKRKLSFYENNDFSGELEQSFQCLDIGEREPLEALSEEGTENYVNESREKQQFFKILPIALEELDKSGTGETIINFIRLVYEKKFPLQNIAYRLWSDVVKWFTREDTRHMRYSEETMQFFWLGRKVFGGKFVRFMSGLKNETENLQGYTQFDPAESKINFACPSENILREYNPLGESMPMTLQPGLLDPVIKLKADKDNGNTSYVLMFDGKKVRRGGDVDLLGYENGKTLNERIAEKDTRLKIIDKTMSIICAVQHEVECVNETPDRMKPQVYSQLLELLNLNSQMLKELRELKRVKTLSLNKLKEKAGKDWKTSTFAYAIDFYRTLLYRIDNAIDKALRVQKVVCKTGAYLNGVGNLFAESNVVDLSHQENVRLLKSPDVIKKETGVEILESHLIQQRTEEWFSARKGKRVTGSTLYAAIGCDSLKRQKEHFDKVVSNVESASPTIEQQQAMQHGTDSEVHQIATLCGVIIPFLFPHLIFHEEGFYTQNNVLVSPDGSLKNEHDRIIYAFEGKAPVGNVYTTPVHYTVPERYLTQTLFESKVTTSSCGTLYMSWTDESATLFTVPYDNEICEQILAEVETVYMNKVPKRPSRLSEASKAIKSSLMEFRSKCQFLGEFPSVQGHVSGRFKDSKGLPYSIPQTSGYTATDYKYDDLVKHLLLGHELVTDVYELQRQIASQVIVILLSDLDRLWKPEEPHAVPVMYFFRGYSLPMKIMRMLADKCKETCRQHGLDVIVSSADGEFIQLMVRGRNGEPLTLNQLSKDIWSEVCKLEKSKIVAEFQNVGQVRSVLREEVFSVNAAKNVPRTILTLESEDKCISRVRTPSVGWNSFTAKRKGNARQNENATNPCSELTENAETHAGTTDENSQVHSDIYNDNELIEEHYVNDTDSLSGSDEQKGTSDSPGLADNVDLDTTVLYNVDQAMEVVGSNASESDQSPQITSDFDSSQVVTDDDKSVMLGLLKNINKKKWQTVTGNDLSTYFRSAETLKKFTVKELVEITKYLNVKPERNGKLLTVTGLKKVDLINQLSKILCDGTMLEVKANQRRKVSSVLPLKKLASAALMKKTYPKQVLNIAYSRFIWPERVSEWRKKSHVADQIKVIGSDEYFEPYYVPDSSTGEFEVFVCDKTHLGSNLRKVLCLDKIQGVSKQSWETVAAKSPHILNPVILEVSSDGKIVDQMKEKLARNLFSAEVEEKMVESGFVSDAKFCHVVREALYAADDKPGIPALERCKKRIELIEWLKSDVDFGRFPPYGARIKGLPHILYEGLRSSQEAKLFLYALSKRGTYSVRAPNTLCSESFFSSMQEMDPWGQGILTTKGVEKHITDFTTITAMKMKEDKPFYIKTKRDAAYPVQEIMSAPDQSGDDMEENTCHCRENHFIECILPRDHFFDTKERDRTSHKDKPFIFSKFNEPAKGEQPIRQQYGYRINEAKILESKKSAIDLEKQDNRQSANSIFHSE